MENNKYGKIFDNTQGLLQVKWEWEQWLSKLENEIKPQVYVEIGNEYGAALASINQLLPNARLIGIDLKPPHEADSNPVTPPNKYERCYEFIQGNSHDLETWKKLWLSLKGQRADVLFIDGAHRFDDVYRDWVDYGPLANVVAFHDITYSVYSEMGGFYVHFLWEYLKTQYRSEEIIVPPKNEPNSDVWGGIGILYLKDKLGHYPLSTDVLTERNVP